MNASAPTTNAKSYRERERRTSKRDPYVSLVSSRAANTHTHTHAHAHTPAHVHVTHKHSHMIHNTHAGVEWMWHHLILVAIDGRAGGERHVVGQLGFPRFSFAKSLNGFAARLANQVFQPAW